MHYLIIQLFDIDYFDDLMLALTTVDITNASVVDGLNMDNVMNQNVPLFAGLIPNESEKKKYCKIITSIIDSDDKIDMLLEVFKQADIHFAKDNIGRIILIPVSRIIDEENNFKG